MKLKVWAFGLALGIVWGLSLFVLTLIAINTGYSYAELFLGVVFVECSRCFCRIRTGIH